MTPITLSEAQRTQFERDGFLAVRGLFSTDEIDEALSALGRTVSRVLQQDHPKESSK